MQYIFTKLEQQLQSGNAFAVYRKPDSTVVSGLFQKSTKNHYSKNFTESGFVFAPFNSGKTILLPINECEVINEAESEFKIAETIENQWPVNEDAKTHFESLVQKAVKAINNDGFKKVVLSRKETIDVTINVINTYKNLLQLYPLAFVYCFFHPETGLWMGATPEQLLKTNRNKIHTVALAGTQLYHENKQMVWPLKEQREQQIVTDYIINTIAQYTTDIESSVPYTYKAGNLAHIKTDINAIIMQDYTIKDIVTVLHPTPAICGMPKQEAIDFILQNENYNREYYSGYLGELNMNVENNKEKTDLYVNLRCMKAEDNKVNLYIGCGITADSKAADEFIETANKSYTIKKALQV